MSILQGETVTTWNMSQVWRSVAGVLDDRIVIEQGDEKLTWSEFDSSSVALASWMRQNGVGTGAKVAQYLYNCPEYMVTFAAALHNSCVPVNTNYRYGSDELVYLFDNADAEVLFFHGTFASRVDEIRGLLPKLRHLVFIDDTSGPCPKWAVNYAEIVTTLPIALPEPSPDDLIFLYTGGTTGMPKGVMWRQDDLFSLLNAGSFRRFDESATASEMAAIIAKDGPGASVLPACPLMHGTGLFTAINALNGGGRIVLLENRHFDAVEFARTLNDYEVNVAVIVGDPFARPLLRALEADPGQFAMDALFAMVSSGAMWSEEIKKGLLAHKPNLILVDAFSSSEALGMGSSVSSGQTAEQTARFTLGQHVRVANDLGEDIEPGSEEVGKLMLGGRLPLGYYKDESKTESTFLTFNNVRYSVPGDMAKVNADGSIHLLGRDLNALTPRVKRCTPKKSKKR